jgi:hypothetical protein
MLLYLSPEDPAFDADAFCWAQQSELPGGLEEQLGATFRDWLAEKWPFDGLPILAAMSRLLVGI